MPRPTIPEDDLERLEAIVDNRTKVPVEHLDVRERLAFVLDELEEATAEADRLRDRVETLEEQLVDARKGPGGGVGGSGGSGGLNLGSGRNQPGGRGP